MSASLKYTALAALCLPLLASAAPTGHSKRAGVTCNKTYAGGLVAMNLNNNYLGSAPKQTNVYRDGAGFFAADTTGVEQPVRVQFDVCTTEGWNVDGELYGQVKLENDNYNCFTVTDAEGPSTTINVQPCGDFNGGLLESQWFKGEWDGQGGFHVIPSGNPNDTPNTRPHTLFTYGGEIPSPNEIKMQAQSGPELTELQFSGIQYF